MACFHHLLLSTQITALEVKEKFVFIGEGQYLHVHDLGDGKRHSSTQVFRAAVVHGIRIKQSHNDEWWVAVFGQKSLTLLCFKPTQIKCCVHVEERCFEDWIVDAAWEKNPSHIVLALAHNSLLRCEIQYLTSRCCTDKSQLEDELRGGSSSETAPKNPEERIRQTFDSHHVTEQSLSPDRGSGTEQQKQYISHELNESVIAKAESAEKCVLFCGCIVMMSGSWASVILLAGMVSQQVVVWGPWGEEDSNGRILPLHLISGHEGSIFSVNFCPVEGIITTTSDDRTVRVWSTREPHEDTEVDDHQTLPLNDPDEEKVFWKKVKIFQKHKCYGHSARVWRSLILPSCILSVGEDSKVCVWDKKGTLATSWKAHDGASIWSIAASESSDKIVTGGGDGGVKSWCLNVRRTSLAAEPLGKVPCVTNAQQHSSSKWNQEMPVEKVPEEFSAMEAAKESIISDHTQVDDSAVGANSLLFGEPAAKLKISPKEKPAKADFARTVSLVGLRTFLMVMDSGKLYVWDPESSLWCLRYEEQLLKNYVLAETNPSQTLTALGTLSGTVIIVDIYAGCFKVFLQKKVCDGKIFALLWLDVDQFLVCGAGGAIIVWEICKETQQLKEKGRHTLPQCKQRWLSAACVYKLPKNSSSYLVCGDRAGSLHLYLPGEPEVQHSLRSIHGRNGVTSLCNHNGLVYSTGRDGCVRCLSVQNDQLQVITVTRVSSVNWVAKLIFLYEKPLAICFHDIYLKVWSLEEDRVVAEVECGGGHRSWDILASEAENELKCLFLKDASPYIHSTVLTDKLLPLIKTSVNTHETMCLQMLFQRGRETIFVTGGEDTTLRLHSLWGFEKRRPLQVIRSHISSIRTVCMIEERGKASLCARETKTKWMVSAGGRAQIKVWKSFCGGMSDVSLDSKNHHKLNYLEDKQVDGVTDETYRLQLKTPSSRELDAPKNNETRPKLENTCYNDTSVVCREVTSHMLRTGSNKTWKSQELTFDPETRYMDATAFWVTDVRALVALASSDGHLRIFVFDAEAESLELCCTEEFDHCLLKVAIVWISDRPILVCATTAGKVFFQDLTAVVHWMETIHTDDSSPVPQLQQLASTCAHQSGINGLAFSHSTKVLTSDVYSVMMATAGDDNKLCVWDVAVDTSNDDLRLVITNIHSVFGHASQITGVHWLSSELLVSVSIDQRVITWKLPEWKRGARVHPGNTTHRDNTSTQINLHTEGTTASREMLKTGGLEEITCSTLSPVASCFTGVPDVKGIAVVDLNDVSVEDKDSKRVKRLFVYGVGLQVYDVLVGKDT